MIYKTTNEYVRHERQLYFALCLVSILFISIGIIPKLFISLLIFLVPIHYYTTKKYLSDRTLELTENEIIYNQLKNTQIYPFDKIIKITDKRKKGNIYKIIIYANEMQNLKVIGFSGMDEIFTKLKILQNENVQP